MTGFFLLYDYFLFLYADIASPADYILVVEKESGEGYSDKSWFHGSRKLNFKFYFDQLKYLVSYFERPVFQRLANDRFCSRNRCIVITGRGYPDVPTRRFLRILVDVLALPAFCLVDCDPYGFDILTTYRFGSMQMAYDAKYLRIPQLQWLGAFASDSEKYNLPEQCLIPLTLQDKRRTEALLQRCYLRREVPQWRLELDSMLQRGVKFEIEALSVHNISFLSEEYLPSKIKNELTTGKF